MNTTTPSHALVRPPSAHAARVGWQAWLRDRWPASHPMWAALAARTRVSDWWAGV